MPKKTYGLSLRKTDPKKIGSLFLGFQLTGKNFNVIAEKI